MPDAPHAGYHPETGLLPACPLAHMRAAYHLDNHALAALRRALGEHATMGDLLARDLTGLPGIGPVRAADVRRVFTAGGIALPEASDGRRGMS